MTFRIIASPVAALLALIGLAYHGSNQDNHAPVVKIVAPGNNSTASAGAQLTYELSVADKEDGDTRFDEINGKEVLLEVRYFSSKPRLAAFMAKPVPADPLGLAMMLRSSCFNCHDFRGKAMGPSFADIGHRYSNTSSRWTVGAPSDLGARPTSATDTLMARIKDGSSGVWGKDKMPSHPELTNDEIRSIVRWIFQYTAVRDIDYHVGTTGVLTLPPDRPGDYVLTASYTDHGIKDVPGHRLSGADRIVVRLKGK